MGNLALRRLLLLLLLLLLSISAPPCLDAARRSQRKIVLIFADDQATRRPSSQEKLLNTDSVLPQSAQERKSASLERREEDEEEEEEDFKDFDDLNPKDLDPGSWKTIAEDYANIEGRKDSGIYSFPMSMASEDLLYIEGVRKMLDSASYGDPDTLSDAVSRIREAAEDGHAHAQSTMAFLYGNGIGVEHSDAKAFLYHYFAAEGGNFQSKLALAYGYFRQQMNEQAVELYAELAGKAVESFSSSIDSPLLEPIPLNDGLEENKEALKRFRGEEDDDFQILEYQARKGNAVAMFKVGIFYYSGLRGVRRDDAKALDWFLKAVEKGDSTAMEYVGEIFARGHGVERNFTRALEWFQAALRNKRYSAYNGIGYLYVKGQGVEKRNYTKARDYFKKAAEHDDPDGLYNLGVLYLTGKGVKKDIEAASKHFVTAANAGHAKAYYQLAKLFQKGIGVKKDLAMATVLYKMVAERGPWGSLMRWALESYLKGDIGKALLLYSRAADLGYEIAQSNAAWILEKYHEEEYCLGQSGVCETTERYRRAHTLWWHASEQGNDDAALLIGDAYYYGRGTERDWERAAGAYQHARSQANAQAVFNLGYMYEHGEGLPKDFHLAKRYYDEAVEMNPSAALPVYLALTGLWLRQNFQDNILIKLLDALPEAMPKIGNWSKKILLDEGNITMATLFVCLVTVLYLRQRRINAQVVLPPPPPPPPQ